MYHFEPIIVGELTVLAQAGQTLPRRPARSARARAGPARARSSRRSRWPRPPGGHRLQRCPGGTASLPPPGSRASVRRGWRAASGGRFRRLVRQLSPCIGPCSTHAHLIARGLARIRARPRYYPKLSRALHCWLGWHCGSRRSLATRECSAGAAVGSVPASREAPEAGCITCGCAALSRDTECRD